MQEAFEAIAIDDEGRACRDIPESACREEAGNFFLHAGALSLSKTADGLIDPKLVLSWLITALGGPAALVGLLVPVREAGALLPQLFTSGALRRLPQRKWAWTAGAVVQGLAALVIAFVGLSMSGVAAGWAIIAALACLALARSVCSVSYKDVLGKTIDKSRRGRATGLASTISAAAVIIFAIMLTLDLVDRRNLVLSGIALASIAWIVAGVLFAQLKEEPGATEGGSSAFKAAIENLAYLKSSQQLRRFIATRALLTATALAPPFMVSVLAIEEERIGALGLFLLASAGASLASSFVWGRLSDKSSRKTLIYAAAIACITLFITALTATIGVKTIFAGPVLLFALMISYQGVRLGRSTHLVDMADENTRAAFTALSNSIIGVLLLAGGIFSLVASLFGAGAVLFMMALMAALAIPAAISLEEVQR